MKSIRSISFIAIYSAIIFGAQVALASIPNVEIVTILFFVIAMSLPLRKTLLISLCFTFIEGLYWGFSDWTIAYMYIWPIFIITITLLKDKIKGPLLPALISGIFGLAFGTFCSFTVFFTLGFRAGISYIVAGIMFDLIHGVSNFILMLILYQPLQRVILLVKKEGEYLNEEW